MPDVPLLCDQAIFTSVRTPMGEGYRVIAASKGVKANEKQAITRNSPSHDALCVGLDDARDNEPVAAAFYPLETGRLALSLSGFAGSEHTGRGGGRVYTTIIVFDRDGVRACGFNPFHILRALLVSGACRPRLKPATVLPELSLSVTVTDEVRLAPPPLAPDVRVRVLRNLFDARPTVVNTVSCWLETAEALLLALPGPLRMETSFSAGIQFSLSRMHRLGLLSDRQGKAKLRTTGQKVQYVDPDVTDATAPERSSWFDFVERCYDTGKLTKLARRTSRPYEDCSLQACERVGRVFELIEQVPHLDCLTLLDHASRSLTVEAHGVEAEAHEELLTVVQRHVLERCYAMTRREAVEAWNTLLAVWRGGRRQEAFARPLLARLAVHLARLDPLKAAELVGQIVEDIDRLPESKAYKATVDEVLARLLMWLTAAAPAKRDQAIPTVRQWARLRPDCPTARQLVEACDPQTVPDSAD